MKNAWVTRWKTPAAYAPTPTPTNMYPSWLTVEYARTRLMSVWTSPIVAAKTAVRTPTHATTSRATPDRSKSAWARATR